MEAWSADGARVALREYTSDPSKVLVALQSLQTRYGYVHSDGVQLVADICNVSRADVHGVLTFYHELRTAPPAKKQIRVCRAEACQAVGARDLESALAAAGHPVGSHTDDVSVEAVYCLGICALGPVLEVDGAVKGRCTTTDATEAVT
jgi:formate dehydrogenase subunit gamma